MKHREEEYGPAGRMAHGRWQALSIGYCLGIQRCAYGVSRVA